MESIKEKAYFNIDSNQYYEGYHIKQNRWNGWATPYFEKRIADLIAHNFSSTNFKITYNEISDCYVITTKDDTSCIETLKAEKSVINTKDGKKEVYDFGSLGWTWEDYTLDEAEDQYRSHIIANNEENQNEINLDY